MPANPILVRDMLSTAHGSIGAERRGSLTQELAHMRTVAVIRRPTGAAGLEHHAAANPLAVDVGLQAPLRHGVMQTQRCVGSV